MHTTFIALPLLTALGILTGCLQHFYTVSVLPDERVEVLYELRGDRVDIEDGRELLPDSALWRLVRWEEERERETEHFIRGSRILDHPSLLEESLNWARFPEDTLNIRRSMALKKVAKLFGTVWIFDGIIYSRRFDELYGDIWDFVPEECRSLEDDDAKESMTAAEIELLEEKFSLGVLQWNIVRFTNRMDRVWGTLKGRLEGGADTSAASYSIARAGWKDDLRLYLNQLDIPEPSVVNLDWWDDLRPVFAGRLVDLVGAGNVGLICRIADSIELEYQISKDFEDDAVKVRVSLPGRVIDTDGMKDDEGGYLQWEFDGKSLLNADASFQAESFDLSYWRVIAVVIIFAALFRALRRMIAARSRKRSIPQSPA